MIEVCELIKDYGDYRAVNQLSFTVSPGVVTGFIGPKGAGKSTTMRIILGLDTPTSGATLVNGQRHTAVDRPMQTVGALPDAGAMHSDCTAMEHLQTLGRDHGIGRHRVVEVLDEVGLLPSADKRINDFSPAMRIKSAECAAGGTHRQRTNVHAQRPPTPAISTQHARAFQA